jgi:hypothetical protein
MEAGLALAASFEADEPAGASKIRFLCRLLAAADAERGVALRDVLERMRSSPPTPPSPRVTMTGASTGVTSSRKHVIAGKVYVLDVPAALDRLASALRSITASSKPVTPAQFDFLLGATLTATYEAARSGDPFRVASCFAVDAILEAQRERLLAALLLVPGYLAKRAKKFELPRPRAAKKSGRKEAGPLADALALALQAHHDIHAQDKAILRAAIETERSHPSYVSPKGARATQEQIKNSFQELKSRRRLMLRLAGTIATAEAEYRSTEASRLPPSSLLASEEPSAAREMPDDVPPAPASPIDTVASESADMVASESADTVASESADMVENTVTEGADEDVTDITDVTDDSLAPHSEQGDADDDVVDLESAASESTADLEGGEAEEREGASAQLAFLLERAPLLVDACDRVASLARCLAEIADPLEQLLSPSFSASCILPVIQLVRHLAYLELHQPTLRKELFKYPSISLAARGGDGGDLDTALEHFV